MSDGGREKGREGGRVGGREEERQGGSREGMSEGERERGREGWRVAGIDGGTEGWREGRPHFRADAAHHCDPASVGRLGAPDSTFTGRVGRGAPWR